MGIISIVGGPGTVSTSSGGKIYAYNNITTANNIQVAPANPARTKITFHNPGTSDILISPVQSFNGTTSSTLTPTNGARGGGFIVFQNGGQLTVEGECQGAWQALSLGAVGVPLTVMDSNL